MSLATAYEEIDDAITTMVSRGWTISPGMFCDPDPMTCCPLGAVIIAKEGIAAWQFDHPGPMETVARARRWASKHGIDAGAFVQGFDYDARDDDLPRFSTYLERDSFEMGREFRRRYVEEVQS